MDVKDINGNTRELDRSTSSQSAGNQKSISSLVGTRATAVNSEAARVDLTGDKRLASAEQDKSREKTNNLISKVNLLSETTSNIDRLVRSIDGIVKQADSGALPERRVTALEREANDLVGKIKEIATDSSTHHTSSPREDEIRQEVERQLGKSLDAILPDDARQAFGLDKIHLSTKEQIISTVASVRAARERVEQLRADVTETRKTVESIVSTYEVAQENSAASLATIRDVDEAVRLASETHGEIAENPTDAMDSVGRIDKKVLDLLRQ
ncbi:MAG: hypothetical protein K1X83_09440 [Oligoflexia bacterium]|nr:hypothetical protein [Oligoflexia bacterium]